MQNLGHQMIIKDTWMNIPNTIKDWINIVVNKKSNVQKKITKARLVFDEKMVFFFK